MPNRVTYTFVVSDRYTAAARRIARSTRRVRTQFKGLAVDAKAAAASLKTTTAAALRSRFGVAAVGAAAFGTTRAFGNLEEGLLKVLTLLDADEIPRFRGRLKEAQVEAVRAGFSIRDTNKALFDTVSVLGVGEEALEVFQASQVLAKGGAADLSAAVEGITRITAAYREENLSAMDVANALFSAQKRGRTDVALLASNIGKVAKDSALAGVGFKELLATTAELTITLPSTEEATTALRATLNALRSPGTQAKKVLEALGVPVGVTEIRAAGLGETLRILAVQAEKFPDALGLAIPNVRAFTGAAALGQVELERIGGTIDLINRDIENNTGLTEAAALQALGFNDAMRRARGEVTIAAEAIGARLAPAIALVAGGLKSIRESFETGLLEKLARFNPLAITARGVGAVAGGGGVPIREILTGRSESRTEIEMNVNDPKNVIGEVKARTTGETSFKVGRNNDEAL